jgi:hypothetical protein
MGRLRTVLSRSPQELIARSRQLVSAILEQIPIVERVPRQAPLMRGFAATAGRACQFPPGGKQAAKIAALHAATWPESADDVVREAERILRGEFDVLGLRSLSYGTPPNWHLDPLSGAIAPRRHWRKVPYLNPKRVGDHKVIWELNRHQHFVVLAQAYLLTNQQDFIDGLVAHWQSWMRENPPTIGINWASSLEVAFRAIAWVWTVQLVGNAPTFPRAVRDAVLRYLVIHGRHVYRYLSTYFSPNTHLTGEALGLLYLGTAFGETREARRWRERGWRILRDEYARQVRKDGTHFEQSTWYHRYTLDIYLHALLLLRDTDECHDGAIASARDMVASLCEFCAYSTLPDGTTPLIGDDDGGQVLRFEPRSEPDDFRDSLAAAAVLLQRPDYCFAASSDSPAMVWLMGPDALEGFANLGRVSPSGTSRAFPDGGFYIMRDRWSADATVILADVGPHGGLAGGHGHADALSFTLSLDGIRLIVDPGTYTYSGAERNRFRGSLAHNTALLDATGSAEPADAPFRWVRTAKPSVRVWLTTEVFDLLVARHESFGASLPGAAHERTWILIKGIGFLLIDELSALGDHTAETRLHFAEDLHIDHQSEGTLRVRSSCTPAHSLSVLVCGPGTVSLEDGWCSRGYATRSPTTVAVCRAPFTNRVIMLTAAAPIERVTSCERIFAPDASIALWSMNFGSHLVTVLTNRTGAPIRQAAIETDAALVLVCRDADSGEAVSVLARSVRQLSIDACSIVDTELTLHSFAARLNAGAVSRVG